jgi:hypothetical protein
MTLPNPQEEFEQRFPEVAAAFRKVDEDQRKALFGTTTSETDLREQIYYSVRALEEVKKKMIAALTNRHIEQIKEDHAATLAKSGDATA